jgi:hypothetical protein
MAKNRNAFAPSQGCRKQMIVAGRGLTLAKDRILFDVHGD